MKPLLEFVPAHLSNTMELINRLKNLELQTLIDFNYPFSLDVESMYTSIPVDEAITNVVNLLTDKNFKYYGLNPNDVGDLLTTILNNMYFEYENVIYRQKYGLPMGANVSGILAILFMDSIEKRVILNRPIGLYARYVDDIFLLTTNNDEANNILSCFNNEHAKINFTIEHPEPDNSIALLDFKLKLTGANIETSFHQKSAKKTIFMNFESALPTQMKLNIVKNERRRRLERCSSHQTSKKCEKEFDEMLKINDYPSDFMKRKTFNAPYTNCKMKKTDYFYFHVPYVSDEVNEKIKRVFHNLDFLVRLYHRSFTLRMMLNNSKNNKLCSSPTCKNPKKDIFYEEMVVYQVKCLKCNALYIFIGSTVRYLHTRINEHLTRSHSSVHKHIETCRSEINITILAKDINAINLRLRESIIIKKLKPKMNNKDECLEYQSLIFDF